MSKRQEMQIGLLYEMQADSDEEIARVLDGEYDAVSYPMFIEREDRWFDDVTDALMALYHYVLAYAPQEEE